jgi:hypothetical protein
MRHRQQIAQESAARTVTHGYRRNETSKLKCQITLAAGTYRHLPNHHLAVGRRMYRESDCV